MSTASYDFLVRQTHSIQANMIPLSYPAYTPPPQPAREEFEGKVSDLEQNPLYPDLPRPDSRNNLGKERILAQECGARLSQIGRAWVKH